MILGVSNIAWAPEERLAAYDLMEAAGVTGLEIAPALFFSRADDPFEPDNTAVANALNEIESRGLSLVSMQSLLFGVYGANLFGDDAARNAFENGMHRAINLAGRLGIPNLVFGSPAQRRIPEGMTFSDAFDQAVGTFHRLGDRASSAGTVISVEPNPVAYGTNFLNTLDEVELFVEKVAHPSVALILDLGAMHMNNTFDTVIERLETLAPNLNHVHVSEPQLAPAPDDKTALAPILAELQRIRYRRAVSIEMRRTDFGLATLEMRIAALMRAAKGVAI